MSISKCARQSAMSCLWSWSEEDSMPGQIYFSFWLIICHLTLLLSIRQQLMSHSMLRLSKTQFLPSASLSKTALHCFKKIRTWASLNTCCSQCLICLHPRIWFRPMPLRLMPPTRSTCFWSLSVPQCASTCSSIQSTCSSSTLTLLLISNSSYALSRASPLWWNLSVI